EAHARSVCQCIGTLETDVTVFVSPPGIVDRRLTDIDSHCCGHVGVPGSERRSSVSYAAGHIEQRTGNEVTPGKRVSFEMQFDCFGRSGAFGPDFLRNDTLKTIGIQL